ncbi:MAG: hypothetical protein AAF787_12540 [Chloroflexota bacterium]
MTMIPVEHISKAFAANADGTGERIPLLQGITVRDGCGVGRM